MKRSRIGAALLLALLLSALAVSWAMDTVHSPVVRDLSLAAGSSTAQTAAAYAAAAREGWDRWRVLRNCFADHGPTEEIDAQFAALEIYGEDPGSPDFSACAAQLAKMVEGVAQAHSFSLGTFF